MRIRIHIREILRLRIYPWILSMKKSRIHIRKIHGYIHIRVSMESPNHTLQVSWLTPSVSERESWVISVFIEDPTSLKSSEGRLYAWSRGIGHGTEITTKVSWFGNSETEYSLRKNTIQILDTIF